VGERVSDDAWAIRLQYKPLVRWLRLGSIFMAIGGFLAISDRRYRLKIKAEKPAKQSAVDGTDASRTPAGVTS